MIRDLFRLGVLLAALALLPLPMAAQTTPFAPVAVVNDAAITGFDLEQRMRLLQVMTDGADPATLRTAALDQLVEDRLKLQEGQRLGIRPTEEMLTTALQRFAGARGLTPEALIERLGRAGVSDLALKDLLSADAVWVEVVRGRFLSRVEPAEGEIDAEIGLIGQGGASTAYRLQEIGLPITAANQAEARALAGQLYAELAAGGDFTAAVRRYSQAPSAEKGGEVGWVDANRLPPELASTLASLTPGQISPPVQVAAGYSIVKVLEVRRSEAGNVAEASPEVRDQIRRKMIEQRIGRLAEGLLQELRRDALIQLR